MSYKYKIAIFIKTCLRDLKCLEQLLNSINKYNKDDIPVCVSISKREEKILTPILQKYCNNIKIFFDEDISKYKYKDNNDIFFNDWMPQQYIKLDLYKTNFAKHYIIIDSDCYFIKDFYIEDFLYDENTPYIPITGHQKAERFPMQLINEINKNFSLDNDKINILFRVSKYLTIDMPWVLTSDYMKKFEEFLLNNNLNFQKLLEIAPFEMQWYLQYVLSNKLNYMPCTAIFMPFHIEIQYQIYRWLGFDEEILKNNYIGIVMNKGHVKDIHFKPLWIGQNIIRRLINLYYKKTKGRYDYQIEKNKLNLLQKLFSVTKEFTLKKEYKVITILGIKFKIKIIKNKHVKKITKLYKKNLERIKRKYNNNEKIKVIFLIRECSKWTYDSLYKEMLASKEFDPIIAVSLLKSVTEGRDDTRNNLEESYEYFKNLGYQVIKAFDKTTNKFVDLKIFNPDIIFYDQPGDLDSIHDINNIAKFALTMYSDYGFELFNNPGNYTSNFHALLYRFYSDSSINIQRYETYMKYPIKNCISYGYPKLDVYKENNELVLNKYWKEPNKNKIIYAPHHSFEKEGLRLATFKENGYFILELAKKNPETTWVFKPHPRFKYALLVNNIMTLREIEEYYNQWAEIGKIYEQGNYFDIFKSSDCLITDCCSFLAEYLPTKKPIIQLVNSDHAKFNELGELITQSNYKAYSCKDITYFFDEIIIKGNDPNKYLREITIPYILNDKKESSKNILIDILKSFKQNNN